jgi:ketosteroid isomerase-like protein
MKKFLGILIAMFALSMALFAQDTEAVKAKIEKLDKVYEKAMLDNDVETMLSMYANDVISMPSYQPTVRGITRIRELSETQSKSGWETKKFILTITDVLTAGDLAIEIGNYDMIMSGPNVPEWKDNGKYLTVWEMQKDGSLKIKVETWNTNRNPWEQMEQDKEIDMDQNGD